MWKKIAIAGAVGVAILGTGAAALAETGATSTAGSSTPAAAASSSAPPSSASGTGAKGHQPGALRGKLKLAIGRLDHGTWVTQGKDGPVTHAAVKGTVTTVSASSITVKAADGTSETFGVNSSTAVRVKGAGKSSIGSVHASDTVLVTGTQSGSTTTAAHVLDGGAK